MMTKNTNKQERDHIIKELKSSGGTHESSRLYVITTVYSGETEVVINYTISKRFPIQKLEEAERMYEKLHETGGRRVYDLEEIANQELVNKDEL